MDACRGGDAGAGHFDKGSGRIVAGRFRRTTQSWLCALFHHPRTFSALPRKHGAWMGTVVLCAYHGRRNLAVVLFCPAGTQPLSRALRATVLAPGKKNGGSTG